MNDERAAAHIALASHCNDPHGILSPVRVVLFYTKSAKNRRTRRRGACFRKISEPFIRMLCVLQPFVCFVWNPKNRSTQNKGRDVAAAAFAIVHHSSFSPSPAGVNGVRVFVLHKERKEPKNTKKWCALPQKL